MTMSKAVTVSVLMAVYNTPFEWVKRAVDSVMAQDFPDFELIILDDGSTEDLTHQLLALTRQYAHKVTFIHHRNLGQSQAINRGIPYCRGKYIAIIDSDDEYRPNHLSVALAEMAHSDLIASVTETVVDSQDDYFVPDKHDLQKNVHVDDCYLLATFVGKKEVFQSIPFEDRYSADSEFFEQAARRYRVKKLQTRTYIYYRNGVASITARMKNAQLSLS